MTTAVTATRNATSAVASLNSPSPSAALTSGRGTLWLRMIRPAASGSVGEITAPSANAAAHGSPTSAWATTATAPIVTSTSPTETIVIPRRLARMSPRFAKNAAL